MQPENLLAAGRQAVPERLAPEDYLNEQTYTATRAPVEAASTLIGEAYRSATFHRLEQQRVFAGSWVAIGYAEEVREPGQVLVGRVAGQSVIVTRNREGRLRAFHNVCRHRGTALVDEACTLTRFRCPYHSWTYDLDGNLLGAPLFEGSDIPDDQRAMFDKSHATGFDPAALGLLAVRTDTWAHLVFVNLDAHAPPLAEWLGDLPDRLSRYPLQEVRLASRRPYTINANWKLVAENFMEYYHLPWVHPELAKVSRIEDHYRFQGPGMYTGMSTTPVTQDDESGWSSLRPLEGLDGDDAVSGRFIVIFPNVALAVLPNHVFTMLLTPTAHDQTHEETSLALHPSNVSGPDASTAVAKLAGFWNHVNGEDIEIVERVQRGVANHAYSGGPMCYRFEEPLHRFQNMVIDRMVSTERIPPGDEPSSGLVDARVGQPAAAEGAP